MLAALLAAPSPAAAMVRISLEVDATDVTHGIQHAYLVIPVRAGPRTLAYPKWVPGEHGPNGPITEMINLHVTAAGRDLAWRRDSLDAFSFHIDVPQGVDALDVRFDYFSPPKAFGPGFGETPNSTRHLLIILFSQLVLYPSDASADLVMVTTKVRVPAGWKIDSALTPLSRNGDEIALPVTTLYTLADSPMLAGEYFRSFDITLGTGATRLSVAADAPADLAVNDTAVAGLQNLVAESAALFGPGHYRRYVWLASLSNRLSHDGTEHHESSDVREAATLFIDPAYAIDWRLFPHEYVHSWNGKYMRPAGLHTVNYQQPMIDDLLWMYEGLTRYYGDFVLTARSGLASTEQTRAYLAYVGAQMDRDRPGRNWRPLADTASAVPAYGDAPAAWTAIRRGPDYYNEMLLIWLEADMDIRNATRGRKSLDDFCAAFFSGPEREPAVKPYVRSDVIDALHRVAPLDWDAFLTARINAINPRAPLGGLRASGWALAYDDTPNAFIEELGKTSGTDDLSLSLGVWVDRDGTVQDVVTGSPAFDAGLAPGVRLTAINSRPWTAGAARDAIVAAEQASAMLELTVASGDSVQTLRVNYHDGLRYPHLTRDPFRPDLLSQVLAPRAAHARDPGAPTEEGPRK